MAVLRSERYAAAVAELVDDPIVAELAGDLPANTDLEAWDFILAASEEYRRRGGTVEAHVGGVAEAIARIRGA